MEFFNKLANDEYGFEVNKFLRKLAKVVLIIGIIISILPIIGGAFYIMVQWDYLHADVVTPIALLVVIACAINLVIFFISSVTLLWFASVGTNTAHIRQQLEKKQ